MFATRPDLDLGIFFGMARDESPREDLMLEAVAFVHRIELQPEPDAAPVVIGFRQDGSASVFFDDDPVVQFNTRRQVRRGYHAGRLIKAEQGRLVALTRVRTETETQLVRHELSDEEANAYLQDLQRRLRQLRELVNQPHCLVHRQVPADVDVLDQVRTWLNSLSEPLRIASAPSAG